ncbi:hypothetical protein [Streptomyces tuirus]
MADEVGAIIQGEGTGRAHEACGRLAVPVACHDANSIDVTRNPSA